MDIRETLAKIDQMLAEDPDSVTYRDWESMGITKGSTVAFAAEGVIRYTGVVKEIVEDKATGQIQLVLEDDETPFDPSPPGSPSA